MKIVLLFPPVAPFEQPHLSLPSLAAFLRENGYDVIQRDINIEAHRFFLDTSQLKRSYRIINETIKRMEKRNKLRYDHEINKYALLVKSALSAPFIIENIEKAKSIFRDKKRFFDPGQYKWAREIVEGALELISCVYYPTQWRPYRYETTYSDSYSKDILKAIRDESTNIFLNFFRRNIITSILKEKPSLVGISITYRHQIIPSFTLAHLIKQADKKIHVTVGGSFITHFSDNFKTNKKMFSIFDSFIAFEGEHALLQLARQIECRGPLSKVPNIIYRNKNRIHCYKTPFIEDINALPPPSFDGLPLNAYFSPALVIPYAISRGCYWNKCVFCAVSAATRLSYRRKKASLLIREIRHLSDKYKTRYFFFCIDTAACDELANLSEQLQNEHIRIYWQCEARLEKGFTQKVCSSIARAGCRQLIFGLESASQKMLDLMKKGTKVANFKRILQNCHRNHIAVNLQYFFGFPRETPRDIIKTIKFISDNRSYITSVSSSGVFRLLKRSKMCINPLRYGIIKILNNRKDDFSLSYKFKVKLKGHLQKNRYPEFPALTSYDWLGMPYNAHALLFFSHYNLPYCNKLVTKLQQPQRREYKNLLSRKPRKNERVIIKRCNYNLYKMMEYIGGGKIKQGTVFPSEKTHVVGYNNKALYFRSYVDIKNIIDLCNGKNTVNRIITLLIDKYADKHSRLSDVFVRHLMVIKSLLDHDILY